MKKIDLENLIKNIFIEDQKTHKEYTYISQIGVLTIKSLIPSIDDFGVRINYKRFSEELNLWEAYRTGENPSLLNMKEVNPKIYWNEEDDSIFSRIAAIMVANQEYEVIEEEIIRNILFTTGNLREFFQQLSIGYLIYLIIQKEENILDKLKQKIIGFGQIDFLEKYETYYRLPLKDYIGNYKVDFEKEKISIISLLNDVDNGKYPNLSDVIGVINDKEGKTFIGRVLYGCLHGNESESEIPKFYSNLGTYLSNLRKSRIDPKDLQIKEYILPDVFSFNEGDVFFHSLLNDSKITKKEVRSGILTSFVQTKTGMYVFEKIDL